MNYRLMILTCVLSLFNSCVVDYDMDQSSIMEAERLVINSFLSPFKPIRVDLYKLQKDQNNYSCIGVVGAHIILKENETTLFDDFCSDSIFTLNYFPVAGATYSIEVSYENLAAAKATTSIPKAIHCTREFTYEIYWKTSSFLIKLNDFIVPQNNRASLWITAYQELDDGETVQYNEIYVNNVFIDKTNSCGGMKPVNDLAGSIYYESFLRIKNTNIHKMEELIFTPVKAYYYEEDFLFNQEKIKVKLITASPEYDQYSKNLYEQKNRIINEEDISSVFYQPSPVYCNIENGLGLFAGMNEIDYYFDYPVKTE